jgi:hypothetical protein
MSEDPPRVHVALPGGHATTGRLLRWRQGPDGAWWAEAVVYVPAAAVEQVDGEDYAGVPREPAASPRYVLTTDTRGTKPAVTLHRADCWLIDQPATWTRVTPVDNPDQARAALRFDDTAPCDICKPAP